MRRKTKIIATVGPASASSEMLGKLIDAGVNIFRVNLSHGDQPEHAETIARIREAAKKKNSFTAVMADLQGPKIRIGRFAGGPVFLKEGAEFTITTEQVDGNDKIVSTDYPALADDVKPGDQLLIADGLLSMKVKKIDGPRIICEVTDGGKLSDRKGINLPGTKISLPTLTEKDISDLEFAVKNHVDAIAISFVRQASDIGEVRRRIAEVDPDNRALVIGKIEKPEAIAQLDGILEQADGIMVARGDLGVEMPPESVPFLQKQLISRANKLGKRVITATQMLESMTENPRPTRAEVSDVANAVFDGTDAVMLSGETSVGVNPVETVKMMARICIDAETHLVHNQTPELDVDEMGTIPAAISGAVDHLAGSLNIAAILSFTLSGATARILSKTRPMSPIYSFCRWPDLAHRLSFLHNVHPRSIGYVADVDEFGAEAERILLAEGSIKKGDMVLVVAGSPLESRGQTNLVKLHLIQDE